MITAPLYQLSAEYQQLLQLASETDDPADLQVFNDTLQGIEGEIDAKLMNCAAVVKTLDAQAAAVDMEYRRLGNRAGVISNTRERIKAYMQAAMEAAGKDKVKGDLFTVSLQNNPGKVIVVDEAAIPPTFKKTTVSVVTSEISKALKTGEVVPGAHLEQSRSLRIR